MKKGSTLLLKIVLVFLGLAAFAACMLLPRVIGQIDAGGYDPILIGLYIPVFPFLIALTQSWKLLNLIEGNKAFTQASVDAFKKIKYCGIAISLLFAAGMPYIFYVAEKDDAPGVVLIVLVIIGASFVIATFAGVLQKLIQNAVDIKSENDLTV